MFHVSLKVNKAKSYSRYPKDEKKKGIQAQESQRKKPRGRKKQRNYKTAGKQLNKNGNSKSIPINNYIKCE